MQAFRAKIKKRLRSRSHQDFAAAAKLSSRIDLSVIEGIQRLAATPGCVVHVELVDESCQSFTKAINVALPELSNVRPVSEDSLFAIGSLQKPLISIALYMIIEEGLGLEEQDPVVLGIMDGAWQKKAFDIFNDLLAKREGRRVVAPMTRSPTLKQLLQHESALPPYPHFLWGPEGSFISSDSTFEDTAADLVDGESRSDQLSSRNSDWNYILAGNIVKLACGTQSLADALHSTIFAHFKMHDTIARQEDYRIRRGDVAEAVATTLDEPAGLRIPTSEYLADTASLACGGGFSSVNDIASVLRWIMQQLIQEDDTRLQALLQSSMVEDGNGLYTSTMLGIHADISLAATGSQSFDHEWQKRTYALSTTKKGPIFALSNAGAVRGYSCHYYLIPQARVLFIVMTNSSGILDASNHISNYLLHHLLNLPGQLPILDYVKEVRERKLRELTDRSGRYLAWPTLSVRDFSQYCGLYVNHQSQQRIVVQMTADPTFDVYIQDKSGRRTRSLTLRAISDDELLLLPSPGNDSLDAYGAWLGYKLKVQRSGTKVTSLRGIPQIDVVAHEHVFERGADLGLHFRWHAMETGEHDPILLGKTVQNRRCEIADELHEHEGDAAAADEKGRISLREKAKEISFSGRIDADERRTRRSDYLLHEDVGIADDSSPGYTEHKHPEQSRDAQSPETKIASQRSSRTPFHHKNAFSDRAELENHPHGRVPKLRTNLDRPVGLASDLGASEQNIATLSTTPIRGNMSIIAKSIVDEAELDELESYEAIDAFETELRIHLNWCTKLLSILKMNHQDASMSSILDDVDPDWKTAHWNGECRVRHGSDLWHSVLQLAFYCLTILLFPGMSSSNDDPELRRSAIEEISTVQWTAEDEEENVRHFLLDRGMTMDNFLDEVCVHETSSSFATWLSITIEAATPHDWNWSPFRRPRRVSALPHLYVHWIEVG